MKVFDECCAVLGKDTAYERVRLKSVICTNLEFSSDASTPDYKS